jgi:hypothetical protein
MIDSHSHSSCPVKGDGMTTPMDETHGSRSTSSRFTPVIPWRPDPSAIIVRIFPVQIPPGEGAPRGHVLITDQVAGRSFGIGVIDTGNKSGSGCLVTYPESDVYRVVMWGTPIR